MELAKKRRIFRALSVPVSILAVVLAVTLKTPNPMMILIIPVVFFAYSDGYIGGVLSGLVAVAYSLYFFSNEGQPFSYDGTNIQKLLTILVAVAVIVFLVGALKERTGRAIREREEHVREVAKINEELDEAVAQANQANRAKSRFLSQMSHDIRTPMNVILGMAALAEEETDDPEAVAGYLRKIQSAGTFLLSLINDVLDMSKIESGGLELHPEPYPCEDFLNDIDAMFRSLCEQRKIHFVLDAKTGGVSAVLADKVRFQQIFFNLVSNAVKFTPEGGTVRLAIRCEQAQDHLLPCAFLVQDTGIGMSTEFQQKMFEPFAQEQKEYSTGFQSTGLGLSIVKNIVDAMGGTIKAESREGQGTTFTVKLDLPVAPEADAGREEDRREDFSILQGKRVIAVDNVKMNLELVKMLLQKQGMEVTCLTGGQEACALLEKAGAGEYDVMLLDVRMPGMDGPETARQIRRMENSGVKDIPIVAMTADVFEEDVRRILQSGMNAYLPKPIAPRALYGMLADIVGRNSAD